MSLLSDALAMPWQQFATAYELRITHAEYLALKANAELANAASNGSIGGTGGTVSTVAVAAVAPDAPINSGANNAANPNKSWNLTPMTNAIMAVNSKRAVLIVDNTQNDASCEVIMGPAEVVLRVPAKSYWECPQPIYKGAVTVYNDNDETATTARVLELSYA